MWDPAALPASAVGDPVAISKALQAKYVTAGTGWAECPAPEAEATEEGDARGATV